ncbi:hypothetical protein Micbo1qcDRAFT_237129 [Microdochium bolleyi]|uniref:Apple domain-containing protein n=1 Tax=Microdochium bolleyi TaxID=196109 RepID=A0A136IML2_9PEZI|nr:hypothetical protein Micbo1qcDRAFT_237129 [Microdochium bolleyi]
MPPRYDEAPEAVPHTYPEVHYPPTAPETVVSGGGPASPGGLYKPEHAPFYTGYPSSPSYSHNVPPSATFGYDQGSSYGPGTAGTRNSGKPGRQLFGCQFIVFVLSAIVAILSIAVIGLAAGTGIATNKASRAESELASVSAALAQATAPPDPSDFSKIDKGCSKNAGAVTGTTYTSAFFGKTSYKIYCNANAPNPPVMNLFVGNFDDCIDACASWSEFAPKIANNTSANNNATCAGVSFIPLWTNRTIAIDGFAPGNCYLKPGPLNRTSLLSPNIGGDAVHAALLVNDQ